MKRAMKKHGEMTKAELIRCIKALEKGAPAVNIAFEHERLLHELQVHQIELETQNRELREAQLLLESSRDRYADLYDFAPVGYVTFDDKGVIREINLTAAGMLGVERTRLVGVPFQLHIAREDLALFREHLGKLESPEELVTTELRLARKGGGTLPVVMQSVLVHAAEKRGFLCRAALTDITVRLQAEHVVRDHEARLRAVLDTAVDGIITIDERGIVESFNQSAEKLFGYRASEVIGRNVNVLMPSPYHEQHDSYLANYHATGERKIIGLGREVSGRRKDGGTFPIELAVSEVKLGARRIFTGIVRDITRRKQAEDGLREQTCRYQSLVEASPDAIFVLKHGRIEFINAAGGRLFGAKSAAEVLGKSPFDFFRRSRHELIQQRIDRLSRIAGASPLIDEELVRLDGSTRWVTLSAAMFTEGGETAVQFILRDITERRRLEAELLAVSDREQQRIGHDLHDGLGQQLTALEMKCFVLQEELAGNDVTARREQLQEQARKITEALRECVTVTRSISRGLAPVKLKADGLTGALEQLAQSTRVPGKVECRLACPAPVELEDAQTAKHLYRIAQEAVNNALKHARARRITIHLTREPGALRLQIKDDGRGLPRSRKARSGMGLEVMSHRAHVIGASLEIESKPGKGVSITCTLAIKES